MQALFLVAFYTLLINYYILLANKFSCNNGTTNFNFPIMQKEVGNMESRI